MLYKVQDLSKNFEGKAILKNVTLSLPENRVAAILGPSGCGKTTFLNILSGLLRPDHGYLDGFADKRISYIFQRPRLLPWRTVYDNVAFVLKDMMEASAWPDEVQRVLEMVNLSDSADLYPGQLSGGMQQRVAIARSFAYPADLLLMDEPFQSLDIDLKQNLMACFQNIWEADQRTVFFVTHDIKAAVALGDEIFLLNRKPSTIVWQMSNPIERAQRLQLSQARLDFETVIYKKMRH